MIAIIDYKAGNLRSVELALQKIGVECVITSDKEVIESAERVIFPGVGAAKAAMKSLTELNIGSILKDCIDSGKPVLGICLGTQIIMESSEEDGGVKTLGLVKGKTIRFNFPAEEQLTVPEMGWNQVNFDNNHPVFKNIETGSNFYFVHSYFPKPENEENILSTTEYGSINFCSAITQGNLVATQFHPEKSGRHGLDLLKNFSKWDGKSC